MVCFHQANGYNPSTVSRDSRWNVHLLHFWLSTRRIDDWGRPLPIDPYPLDWMPLPHSPKCFLGVWYNQKFSPPVVVVIYFSVLVSEVYVTTLSKQFNSCWAVQVISCSAVHWEFCNTIKDNALKKSDRGLMELCFYYSKVLNKHDPF